MIKTIWWVRNDLRIKDNPALKYAAEMGQVLPIYILDDACVRKLGEASKCWLHDSLQSLAKSTNNNLQVFHGNPRQIIASLIQETGIEQVVWNRLYEPDTIARDREIKAYLKKLNVAACSFNSNHLWQPHDVLKKDGTPYKVFTPYYRRGCLSATLPRFPLPPPEKIDWYSEKVNGAVTLASLSLMPIIPWGKSMMSHWTPGEKGAADKLERYLQDAMKDYKEDRNIPSVRGTSQLSPHLHFGEISPNQVWYAVKDAANRNGFSLENPDVDCYLSELGWREFSAYLLFHFPQIPQKNFNDKFDRFPWRSDEKTLRRWQKGNTGVPIVDAGMRELWHTGYMHNRVRMIVGSFLVKNLLQDWRKGEAWFWDTLLDADYASNVASWQWVAGSGADAAPYFRIFNPVTQGQKFDPKGEYVKTWCPELAKMPAKFIHNPWDVKPEILKAADIELGKQYPEPVVDLKASRQRALDAFSTLKS